MPEYCKNQHSTLRRHSSAQEVRAKDLSECDVLVLAALCVSGIMFSWDPEVSAVS
jgi:hypothetical protein